MMIAVDGRMSHIQAVFWDLGGVIIRTEDRTWRAAWEARLGLPPGELDQLVFAGEMGRKAAIGQGGAEDVWTWVAERLGLDAEQRADLRRDFWRGEVLDLDLVGYIRGLRANYRTGLISNAWREIRKDIEVEWRIADAFDKLIISAEVGLAKPDPRIYRLALEGLDVEPAQAIFVDDFTENIEAASALGMHTVHFENRTQAQQQVESLLKWHPTQNPS
ncbi:MAG: HAD family hydrolase [Anaerolineales bacterium]